MTQFADMTEVEKDQFRIDRVIKRRDKAHRSLKTYVLKRTGHIPRLIREYPEQFKWVKEENPESVAFRKYQLLEKEAKDLRATNLSLRQIRSHNEKQLVIAGDANRKLKRRIAELEAEAASRD